MFSRTFLVLSKNFLFNRPFAPYTPVLLLALFNEPRITSHLCQPTQWFYKGGSAYEAPLLAVLIRQSAEAGGECRRHVRTVAGP